MAESGTSGYLLAMGVGLLVVAAAMFSTGALLALAIGLVAMVSGIALIATGYQALKRK